MKTIIVLTVVGLMGGDRYSYVIQVPTMLQCYDMASVEMERNSDNMRVTEAVCNELRIIDGHHDKTAAR